MPIYVDKYGLKTTASSEASVKELETFGDALLGFSNKANCIVALANEDLECPVAQAYAAQFFASSETKKGKDNSAKYLARAKHLAVSATDREQAIVQAASYWYKTERRAAANVLEQVLDDNPTDIISAKWAQALHFDTGNSAGILRAPLKVADANQDNAHLHGMLAFGFEECHQLDAAERSVHRAMAIQRSEPWAHHAMAHINEARNTMDTGIKFMTSVSDTWTGLTSFMTTHNWWHICLFLIDLNRSEEALPIYDSYVWAMDNNCVQDQINAISLLYRLERVGVDVCDRWQNVTEKIIANSRSQISVFLDFQFLYALAHAGHPEAAKMEERMVKHAAIATPDERIAWQNVAVPAAPGIMALAKGDFKTAVHQLGLARPFLQSIGGSHAQRELVALFYIDALRGAGEWGKIQQILSLRHRARPHTSWIKAQLGEAWDKLGLAEAIAD